MKPLLLKKYPKAFTLMVLLSLPIKTFAANEWVYQQESDRLTNQTYSLVLSPLPRRDLYDELKLEIVCQNKKLQVDVIADNLIASEGSKFDISYQIDQNPPIALQMTTFPDSKRKGYADTQARQIIDGILAGKDTIFLRLTTMTRKDLAGAIALQGAKEPLLKVLNDCGAEGVPKSEDTPTDYDFYAFQQDFGKLSIVQQKQLLAKIKQLMGEVR